MPGKFNKVKNGHGSTPKVENTQKKVENVWPKKSKQTSFDRFGRVMSQVPEPGYLCRPNLAIPEKANMFLVFSKEMFFF